MLSDLTQRGRGVVGRLARRFKPYRDFRNLRHEVAELRIAREQLSDALFRAGGYLPPPRHLQERVVGGYFPDFVRSAERTIDDFEEALAGDGRPLASFRSVLDFGCGCGRVTLGARGRLAPDAALFGTDIDPEAIEWCRTHYSGAAQFVTNCELPPLSFPDASCDLVYSVSVFTHLPEEMQFAWLEELRRVTRPGGFLLLSFHGENHHHSVPAADREAYRRSGFYYLRVGDTPGLPGFYQAAFHTDGYVRSVWTRFFDVLEVRVLGLEGLQDLVVCRRRPS
jgi:SAM-dependent methyltransferase